MDLETGKIEIMERIMAILGNYKKAKQDIGDTANQNLCAPS